MNPYQPLSDFLKIAKDFHSLSIKNVWRLFTVSEITHVPIDIRDQALDGDIFLELENGNVFQFAVHTEEFTIKYRAIDKEEIPSKAKKVTTNTYWQSRIGVLIQNIVAQNGVLATPFGLIIYLQNNKKIALQYLSEAQYDTDILYIE